MTTTVYINGRRLRLAPDMMIGEGGEAHVYGLDPNRALKLFKGSDDPSYFGKPVQQQGAIDRLAEHQRKLPAFPRGLPEQVIAPMELAYGQPNGGPIIGYTMQLVRDAQPLIYLGDRTYREQGGIDGARVVQDFTNLHGHVRNLHDKQLVIGDFNDLNVLVDPTGETFLVDADSMQYGGFLCKAFTQRFVDPLCCDSNELMLVRPHTPESDWYAFATMLFQSLLYVNPYGGVHRPKTGKRLQFEARVLRRITVFASDVLYPKPALPYGILPDELLERFHLIYEQDRRDAFPLELLQAMRWTTCLNCGAFHARARCPACQLPGAVKEVVVRRGTVKATRVFETSGRILQAAHQGGALRYLYHEGNAFRRETGSSITAGALDPELRFRINRDTTLIGRRQRLLVLKEGESPTQLATDTRGLLPIFDANEDAYFWIQDRQLVRSGRIGSEYIGDVLAGRTLFWVGNRFGFGFYQAGTLTRSFVFDARGRGLNDQVPIPALAGQLIDATCVFSDRLAWFMVSVQDNGRLINRCFVINARGQVIAQASASQNEDSWLAAGIRGRFAAGASLFVATDEGIVRVEAEAGDVSVAQTFPDTESFVDATTQLVPGDGGIYAVSAHRITLLTIQ